MTYHYHVFLSYSRQDSEFMNRVRNALSVEGVNVWTDNQLEAGTAKWQKDIEDAIIGATCLVVILSPYAKASEWVNIELTIASEQVPPRKIIPFLIAGNANNAIPAILRNTQRIEAIRDFEEALNDLVERVCKAVGLERLSKQLELAHATIQILEDQNDTLRGQVKQLKIDMTDFKTEWGVELDRLMSELDQVKNDYHELEIYASQEIDRLSTDLKQTKSDLFDISLENAQLKQQNHVYIPSTSTLPPSSEQVLHDFTVATRKILGNDPLFEWCEIPAGRVKLEANPDSYLKMDQWFEVDVFWMAKYPVTVAQYAAFIAAGGYEQEQFWTKMGWYWRIKSKVTQPEYWEQSPWCDAGALPVVGVSWYEAMAFCGWLSASVGAQLIAFLPKILLPTEAQWQRAAQGDDGRRFPWGNDPISAELANYNEHLKHTTSVTDYHRNVSPFGVQGMTGNVWEWCLTQWGNGSHDLEGDNAHVVKGASWYIHNANVLHVEARDGANAVRYNDRGFRVARSL